MGLSSVWGLPDNGGVVFFGVELCLWCFVIALVVWWVLFVFLCLKCVIVFLACLFGYFVCLLVGFVAVSFLVECLFGV